MGQQAPQRRNLARPARPVQSVITSHLLRPTYTDLLPSLAQRTALAQAEAIDATNAQVDGSVHLKRLQLNT